VVAWQRAAAVKENIHRTRILCINCRRRALNDGAGTLRLRPERSTGTRPRGTDCAYSDAVGSLPAFPVCISPGFAIGLISRRSRAEYFQVEICGVIV
jgi:hypothetical protein